MIKYLFVNDVETSVNELVLKVDYIYCCEDDNFLSDNNNDYIPNKGDKLYFMPGVNVPRVKLKDLSLKYGIKSVRDIEDATHVFYGKNTKDKMLNNHWYYNIPTETLRKIYDESEGIMDEYYRENLREALEHYTEDIVIVGYGIAARLRNSSLDVLTRNIASATLISSSIYYSISEDYRDLFPDILNTEVYHESKLLKYINGADATVIDETMFLQLCDMFNSSDQDNHIIAMEIMANCNYMESLLYIEMLFEKYSNYMANCNTKNHVNFKSLISFLGKYKNYMGTSIVDVMNSLKEKQVLDIEKVNVIMKYYAKEIADSGGNEYFEIKSITLNEETAKLLNTNYVHELIQDFIPEVTEELPQYPVNETEHEEILGEDIEIALARIERKHLKSTLIELEKQNEEVSNNNQIKEDNGDSFEWF